MAIYNKKNTIENIRKSYKDQNPILLAENLLELIGNEKDKWHKIALLENLFPDASSRKWQVNFTTFMKALQHLSENHLISLDVFSVTFDLFILF